MKRQQTVVRWRRLIQKVYERENCDTSFLPIIKRSPHLTGIEALTHDSVYFVTTDWPVLVSIQLCFMDDSVILYKNQTTYMYTYTLWKEGREGILLLGHTLLVNGGVLISSPGSRKEKIKIWGRDRGGPGGEMIGLVL